MTPSLHGLVTLLGTPLMALVAATATLAPDAAKAGTPAQKASETSSAPSIQLPFERYRLANGLEVILSESHRAPVVAVDVWVHVGSGDETPGKTGFAHLFEHMMFQGTEHTGEDAHFNVLKQSGATSVNGTTNANRTNFFEVVPANRLETALWLESERFGFLLKTLTEKSLANQRDVVRNERRQRYDNVAYGKTRFAVNAALYPEGHPYRYLTIGKHEDIEGASLEDVRAFWKTQYVPANVTLALVGDFDTTTAKRQIEKWFGSLRAGPPPPKTSVATPHLDGNQRVVVDDPLARLTRIELVWHGPAQLTDEDLDLDLFTTILGATGWGRLQRALVLVDHPLCESVAVYNESTALSGAVHVTATLLPGADEAQVQLVERKLTAELDKALKGVNDAEVVRARRGTEASFVFALEEALGRAETLQMFNDIAGDPGAFALYLSRLKQRGSAQVRSSAKRWLEEPHVSVITRPVAK